MPRLISVTTVSLKLILIPNSQKLVYAEAGKDFVDYLSNLLTLSVATVLQVLDKEGITVSLENLYESARKVGTYNSFGVRLAPVKNIPHMLPNIKLSSPDFDDENCLCDGYVAAGTYIITDDLMVMPASTITIVSLLSKLDLKDHSEFRERTVRFTSVEGGKLLKALLHTNSKTILTDLFLNKIKQEK